MQNNSFVIGLPESVSRETDQISVNGHFLWTIFQKLIL